MHDAALGSGLVRHQPHSENALGDMDGFRRVFRDLHATAFAAAAGMNLGLDDDAAADLLRRSLGFFNGVGHFASRHRDVVLGQDRLGLIFMDFHGVAKILV